MSRGVQKNSNKIKDHDDLIKKQGEEVQMHYDTIHKLYSQIEKQTNVIKENENSHFYFKILTCIIFIFMIAMIMVFGNIWFCHVKGAQCPINVMDIINLNVPVPCPLPPDHVPEPEPEPGSDYDELTHLKEVVNEIHPRVHALETST